MTGAPIVFMDTETCGLELDAPVWEFAAIRRGPDGGEVSYHCFVEHDERRAELLPEPFRSDHDNRYDPDEALGGNAFVGFLKAVFGGKTRPFVVGAVPSFDTIRLDQMLHARKQETPWHYHLIDIENVVLGYLRGFYARKGPALRPAGWPFLPPMDSDELSRELSVDPEKFERHTAMGDVLWIKAQWDVVFREQM